MCDVKYDGQQFFFHQTLNIYNGGVKLNLEQTENYVLEEEKHYEKLNQWECHFAFITFKI